MGSDSIPMAGTVYVGIATTSHNATTATDAVLDNVKVTPGGSSSNQPPTVTLTAPANGASYTAPASMSLTATASDPDGTIAKVEFYNGTTLLNTDTTAPYAFTWSSVAAGSYAIRAVAYDNAGASGSSATATITVTSSPAVPAPWTAGDVGSPALAGSSSYSNGVYSVHAGGMDIWGTSDQFHFVYQPMTGDGEVVAHVQSLTNTDSWAKTGVMIRETLAADSRHAAALVTPGAGYAFQRRIDPAGISLHTAGPAGAAPGWVRLVRTASRIDAYQSSNGSTWTLMGSDAIPMAATVYVGIATTSHNTTTATDAVLDNFKVTSSGSAANQPPTVILTAPANGTTYTAPATITLSASASDPDGTIARVEFYNGSTLLNTDTTAPYSFSWLSVAAGTYALKAIAYDNNGASTSSAISTITVSTTTTTPPTGVTFTASPDHATLVTSYELRIYASGADPNTATPIATSDLGKPTPDANNNITVDRSAFFSALGVGNYVAAVAAIGSGGSSISTGVTFIR
jgi:hypothetical protein